MNNLATQPLAAPVYLIVGGTTAGQGAVVTRDRCGARTLLCGSLLTLLVVVLPFVPFSQSSTSFAYSSLPIPLLNHVLPASQK